MVRFFKWASLALAAVVLAGTPAWGGELKRDYFAATPPGVWAQYDLTSSDGTRSRSTSDRKPDEGGQVVVETGVKILAGPGAGTDSKNLNVLPKGFNLSRDWLSYGVQVEKMTMQFGGTSMPIDANTLAAIRAASKDYRGAVTFEGTETVAGHACDRYAYSVTLGGPAPGKEDGKLWLDPTVPFGVVKQTAKSGATSFELLLTEVGAVRQDAPTPAVAVEAAVPAPATVALLDGYRAGKIALHVAAVASTGGRQLRLTLKNTSEGELTVKLPTGPVELPGSSPIERLLVTFAASAPQVLPAGESGAPITVAQRGTRGPVDGSFTLSFYEGTPLYSGSVTMGSLR